MTTPPTIPPGQESNWARYAAAAPAIMIDWCHKNQRELNDRDMAAWCASYADAVLAEQMKRMVKPEPATDDIAAVADAAYADATERFAPAAKEPVTVPAKSDGQVLYDEFLRRGAFTAPWTQQTESLRATCIFSAAAVRSNGAPSPWIKCSERMPEVEQRVFARHGDLVIAAVYVAPVVFGKRRHWFEQRLDGKTLSWNELDAWLWMPVPPLPEAKP